MFGVAVDALATLKWFRSIYEGDKVLDGLPFTCFDGFSTLRIHIDAPQPANVNHGLTPLLLFLVHEVLSFDQEVLLVVPFVIVKPWCFHGCKSFFAQI